MHGALKQELDFVIVGAQKSGTTSLFEYMRRHPELCVPNAKEAPYFSTDAEYRRMSWEAYLQATFPAADPRRRWGTITPQYMIGGLSFAQEGSEQQRGDPRTVPARIHERCPGARLIAILRDPVERARSHHAMARYKLAQRGEQDERSFAEVIIDLLEPEALAAARACPRTSTGYITWGEYGRILTGYYEVFPADQILVLYTSELKSEPAAVMRRMFSFLGVDEAYLPDNLGTVYRPTRVERHIPWLNLDRVRADLAAHGSARAAWSLLPEGAQTGIEHSFGRLNRWVDVHNRRHPPDEFPHLPAAETTDAPVDDVPELRAHFDADGRVLAELLGGVAPPWLGSAVAAA